MSVQEVHWHEGMFLRPQHLQAAQRYLAHLVSTNARWDNPYNWGLRQLEIDREALLNHRLVIRTLQARLRGGTVVSLPEDGVVPDLDLKPVLEGENAVTIFLGLPIVRLGQVNVANQKTGQGGRYLLNNLELEDENTGLHPQNIKVRRPNLELLLSTQSQAGYEVLPLIRLEKASDASGTPMVHLPYIPPLLSCNAWGPLLNDILRAAYDRIGRKSELLADQILSRGISLESHARGDSLIVNQLRVLNEALALLKTLSFVPWIHPLPAYIELCRLVGQLAIFGDSRRLPNLPDYDHEDLGGCFYQVKRYLDGLLDRIVEPDYKQRPFEGAGLRMQVTLEPSWLEPGWDMYVGVKSTVSTEECVNLLTRGRLDMKIGSSDRVDRIFEMGAAGLKFSFAPTPPRALPTIQGLIYFQLNPDSEEWQNVRKSLTLAIRLNENHIAGLIQGQRTLTIRLATGQTTSMEFTLYVLKAAGTKA
jgi:type VI secretion system protein ImpJ